MSVTIYQPLVFSIYPFFDTVLRAFVIVSQLQALASRKIHEAFQSARYQMQMGIGSSELFVFVPSCALNASTVIVDCDGSI